jgi:hypothetical protein
LRQAAAVALTLVPRDGTGTTLSHGATPGTTSLIEAVKRQQNLESELVGQSDQRAKRSKIMGSDGRTWIGQQREGLIRHRQDLWRDLEELASSSVPVKTSAQQARRDRIAAELDDIDAHLADLNVDERNIGSMEGRE